MRVIRAGFVMCAMMAAGAGARAASFDCKLAKTPVEKAICADKGLSAADDAMAAKYKEKLAEVPPDVQVELRAFQRAWLGKLADHCRVEVSHMSLEKCLQAEYKGQMSDLDQRVSRRDGIVFVQRSKILKVKDDADSHAVTDAEENPGYGTLNASWVEALSDAPEWKAWNAAVVRETQKMAGGSGKVTQPWDKSWAADADTDIVATLDLVSPQMVSVSLTADYMGHGAAHPNEASAEFYWLLQEKRKLTVADVFQAGTLWERVISARCRASLKAQIGADYASYAPDFAKTLHDVIADSDNWQMDGKGLTISFPEYSVTPRVEPADPVTVPWSALQPYLAKGFVLPK